MKFASQNFQLAWFCLLLLWTACCTTSWSQNPSNSYWCAVQHCAADHLRLDRHVSSLSPMSGFDEVQFVPIQFFLVGDENGNLDVHESEVKDALCLLNEYFEPAMIQFYFKDEFQYIIEPILFYQENLGGSLINATYLEYKVADAINVFIGSDIATGNSGYYTGGVDVIYMDGGYVNNKDVILAHELGHFLSLRHTFYGWEGTFYDSTEPTPTEFNFGSLVIPVEYVDRTVNCDEAADRICDTPADYIHSWGGGCNYTGGAVDPDGELIDPDEKNVMAYYSFSGCFEFYFSEQQMEVMRMDLEERTDLFELAEPDTIGPSDLTTLIKPEQNNDEVYFEQVELAWEAVDEADFYWVELSRLNSMAIVEIARLVKSNEVVIDELLVDKTYYWRVSAFDNREFCALDPSPIGQFSTHQISSVNQTQPAGLHVVNTIVEDLLFFEASEELEDEVLMLLDIQGRPVMELKPNQDQVNLSSLSSGLYYIYIEGKQSSSVQRIIKL